ncbi:hypothetical protein B0H67DRAFT_324140 [Lasiosphaeris hirsuta]|uniref:Suppressor of anucleate metulae protein B n=1 Tax=Lasiosphaeris hirsuta TaxID=260670 RepID=A0AA40A264_9PEZI|nr:hypothetical protein B0H67DRAFT_324140 [Lasiosphaeris hirsuta]
MALRQEPEQDDKSAKAEYFRYLRWATRGRKDDESPLTTGGAGEEEPAGPGFGTATEGPHGKYTALPGLAAILSCASCGNLRSSSCVVACEECTLVDGGDGIRTGSAYYCDSKCQMKHHRVHDEMCKQIRGLSRAAQVFQEAFVHFLQTVHDPTRSITSISQSFWEKGRGDGGIEGRSMVVVRMEPNTLFNLACFGGHVLELVKSPKQITPFPELQKAPLMVGKSSVVVTSAKSLLEYFVRPACKSMQRVAIIPKNVFRAAQLIDDEGASHFNTLTPHEVIRVTLECGRQYALDPAGAEFGCEEHITGWEAFVEHRVALVVEERTLEPGKPWSRMAINNMIKDRLRSGPKDGEPRTEMALVRCFVADLAVPTIERHLSMAEFPDAMYDDGWIGILESDNIRGKLFESHVIHIRDLVGRLLLEKAADFERDNSLRFFFDTERQEVRVAIDPELSRKLTRVWMDRDEVRRLAGEHVQLRKAWGIGWNKVFGIREDGVLEAGNVLVL